MSNSNLRVGYKYIWAGLSLTWFHRQMSKETQKQFDPTRLRPIPIFYRTPNFPVIIIQT